MQLRLFGRGWCLAPAVILITLGGRVSSAAPPVTDGQAIVTLRPRSIVEGNEVLISHVARVETTNVALKAVIESLDLIEAPVHGNSASISPRLVEFRMRLAGIDPQLFSVRGARAEVSWRGDSAASTIDQRSRPGDAFSSIHPTSYSRSQQESIAPLPVHPRQTSSGFAGHSQVAGEELKRQQSPEDAIYAAAKKVILDNLPWNEEDVSFRLVQAVSRDAKQGESGEELICTARLRSPGPPIGRVNVDVTMKSGNRPPVDIPVSFDVRHHDTVISAVRPIPRGRRIEKDDVYQHRSDVTDAMHYFTQPDQIVGRVSGRSIPAAQIMKEQDLERPSTNPVGTERPAAVKKGSRVKLTAKIGDLNLTVACDALQDGKIGETIRVQNVESKSVVQGRVLSAEEVEVSN